MCNFAPEYIESLEKVSAIMASALNNITDGVDNGYCDFESAKKEAIKAMEEFHKHEREWEKDV